MICARVALFVLATGCAARAASPAGETRAEARAIDRPASRNEARLEDACGKRDGRIRNVARRLGAGDADRAGELLRGSGAPYVRPWLVRAPAHTVDAIERLDRELRGIPARPGERRCGVAIGDEATVVVVDVLADADLPLEARTGQWIDFDAALRVSSRAAKLHVLGPRGRPRSVPTSVEGRRVRARFALDAPGAFTVQLVGDIGHGPEPLLEARMFADVTPFDGEAPAPGEDVVDPDPANAIAMMTNEARTHERVRPLARSPELDALARDHAAAMAQAKRVAHDLGDGDAAARFERAGLDARRVGENVARAASVALAHRALWASPSHRTNLLGAEYTRMGVAVATADGYVYVCQIFS